VRRDRFLSTGFLQNLQIRKELDDVQKGQTMLVDRLIACCKEVRPRCASVQRLLTFNNQQSTSERAQKLFATLGEELEKRRAAKGGGLDGLTSPAPVPVPPAPATPAAAG
jgi:hypothetical protein